MSAWPHGRTLCSGRSRFLRFLFRAAGLLALFFRFASFLLRRLIDLLIDENGGIYPLQIGDGSSVTFAQPEFHDSGVTAVAIGRARRDFIEQLFHSILLPENRESGATSMDRPLFAEGDHFFRERPDRFGLRQRGTNTLMLDQAANLICQQRLSMLGGTTELYRFLLVSHREISRRAMAAPCPLHWSWRRHRLRPAFPPNRDQISFRV